MQSLELSNTVVKTKTHTHLFSNTVLMVYLFVALWGISTPDQSNAIIYLFTGVFLVIYFVCLLFENKMFHLSFKGGDVVFLIFPIIWLYGFVLGLINGNNQAFIFRNFSGMLFYLFLFVLRDLRFKSITKLLLFISRLVIILTPILYIFVLGNVSFIRSVPLFNNFQEGFNGDNVVVFYRSSCLMFIQYIYSLSYIVILKRIKLKHLFFVLLTIFNVVFITRSGGFLLVLAFCTLMVLVKFIREQKIKKANSNWLFFSVLLLAIMLSAGVYLFADIFSKTDIGNTVRFKQIEYSLETINFAGKGLGATYEAIGQSYAIEIIYLDLFNKFGLLSFVLFVIYILTLILAIYIYLKCDSKRYESAIPLGLVTFIIYSLGNPYLFSVTSVISHIIAVRYIYNYRNIIRTKVSLGGTR